MQIEKLMDKVVPKLDLPKGFKVDQYILMKKKI